MTAPPRRDLEAPSAQEDVEWGPHRATTAPVPVDAAAAPGGFHETAPGFADAAGFPLRRSVPDVEQLLRDAEAALRPAMARAARNPGPVILQPSAPPGGHAAGHDPEGALRMEVPPAPLPPWDPAALRRQLLNHGPATLGDEDLAALLLGLALPADPRPLAAAAVQHFGSFAALLSADERELRALRGFGPHAVAAVRLVQAAAIRLRRAAVMREHVLDRWDRVIAYLSAALARERVEQFRVLFLDAAGRLLADEAQARGTVNHTPVYPREVARRALELDAGGLILVHNHPSGDPTPSREDREMTAQVRDAVECLGLQLLDHVIIGNGRHTSFRAEGLL